MYEPHPRFANHASACNPGGAGPSLCFTRVLLRVGKHQDWKEKMKTTIELAREAGAHDAGYNYFGMSESKLKTFAALLRADWEAEREKTKPLPGADWTITMRRMMNSGCSKRECTCKPENAENCIWWDEPGDAPQPAAQPKPLSMSMFANRADYEEAMAKREPQPLTDDGKTCSNCTFHYKDIDMKPCSNCERGDNIEDNWMPMSTGQIALNIRSKE